VAKTTKYRVPGFHAIARSRVITARRGQAGQICARPPSGKTAARIPSSPRCNPRPAKVVFAARPVRTGKVSRKHAPDASARRLARRAEHFARFASPLRCPFAHQGHVRSGQALFLRRKHTSGMACVLSSRQITRSERKHLHALSRYLATEVKKLR
jgi:hypothetical protein